MNKKATTWVSNLVREFNMRHFSTHAASTAYFYFLSLIPIFIFVCALIPLTGMGRSEMVSAMQAVTPDIVSDILETAINDAFQHAGALLPISVLTLLWTSIQGNMALLRGMNNAYQQHETRPYWVRVLISLGVMVMLVLFVLVLLVFIFSRAIRELFETYFPLVHLPFVSFSRLRVLVCFVAMWLLISFLYWRMPNGRRLYSDQLPGALLVTVAWFVFSAFFSIYVNGVNKFTSFYGTLGTFAIALFWLYCLFYILLIGGFANCFFAPDIHRANCAARAWMHARFGRK